MVSIVTACVKPSYFGILIFKRYNKVLLDVNPGLVI